MIRKSLRATLLLAALLVSLLAFLPTVVDDETLSNVAVFRFLQADEATRTTYSSSPVPQASTPIALPTATATGGPIQELEGGMPNMGVHVPSVELETKSTENKDDSPPSELPTITEEPVTPVPSSKPSSSANPAPSKSTTASSPRTTPTPSATSSEQPPAKKATTRHYGNASTINANVDVATTVTKVKGVGTIPVVITLDPKSAAPALPTYVMVSCTDRLNPYNGGYNTIGGETTVKHIPYSGDCSVKVRTAYPTSNWHGTYNAIIVSTGKPVPLVGGGTPYTERAGWTSRPVSGTGEFAMSTPAGFRGSVALKVTACSTRGGATDKTASFACDGHVNKTNSKGRIEVLNGGKIVATQEFNIAFMKHHETFTIPVELNQPGVTIRVVKTGGTSILVHGPGSSITGLH